MAKPALKANEITVNVKDVIKRYTLSFTDISGNSNKYYNLEVQESVDGKYYLYTNYGRIGGTAAKEYRICSSQSDAESEAEKIVKSKIKKGYVEVKLTAVAVGSDIAKSKISFEEISEDLAKKAGYKIQEETKSNLHPSIQSVVKNWFGSIEQFVINTLDTSKCALGQLSIEQINKGRDLLLEARRLVSAGAKDITELNSISSKYYSNIPMNFGYRRLDANSLRFDTNDKLDAAFELLDTLEGAKDVEKILTKKNAIDEQYRSLKTDMEYIDPADPLFKWIDTLFNGTWVNSHSYLGRLKVSNVFKLGRKLEFENYLKTVDYMSKHNQHRVELPSLLSKIYDKRPKDDKEYEDYIKSANILPLFHGTRNENISKILSSSLRFRKPGFTVSGAMFDKNGGLYFGFSSKGCGYTSISNSYWAKGNSNKAYLFVSDVALGKQTIATRSYPYTFENIHPNMSVWAKANTCVLNDEFIVFRENQNWLRYVIEIEKK